MASGPAVFKGCLDSCTGLEAALLGPVMAPESNWPPLQPDTPWPMWVLWHGGEGTVTQPVPVREQNSYRQNCVSCPVPPSCPFTYEAPVPNAIVFGLYGGN